MPTLNQFDPPGFAQDLDANERVAWSKWISDELDAAASRTDRKMRNYGPRPQFFNPLKNQPVADAVEADIHWTAFPRIVAISSTSDRQRWQRADASRDLQDEYCEWSVTRDPGTQKITRVTFTSEGPEYWEFLAARNPARVLELYHEHVSSLVRKEDLFQQNKYNPRNQWNASTSHGAMHLIQRANTLGAEIELAAAATLLRANADGTLKTDEQDLIDCGQYGAARRHSDPHIGAEVNGFARKKADVTLANPVGLCIADLSVPNWVAPDGSDAKSYWKITRGTPEKALRAVYEVPAEKGFTVSDITIDDQPILFGGQIADFITIKLTGLATRFGASVARPVGCVEEIRLPGAAPAAPDVAAILEASAKRTFRI
jgi:hypothetical protein